MNTEQWIKCNMALIVAAAKPYMGKGMEQEDLMQEALLAALIAINKYDDERTWSLSSWVYYCIQTYLSKKIKSENQYIYHEMPRDENGVAMAIETKRKLNCWVSPTEDEALQHILYGQVMKFSDTLTDSDKVYFKAIVDHENCEEFAKKQNVHRVTVCRRKRKVRDIFAENFAGWFDSAVVV